jgi:hypothetical protein
MDDEREKARDIAANSEEGCLKPRQLEASWVVRDPSSCPRVLPLAVCVQSIFSSDATQVTGTTPARLSSHRLSMRPLRFCRAFAHRAVTDSLLPGS